ncbi:MAG: tail-specific protease [Chlamydiae bacterium RIFCSPHIGHO2_12_FULL_44_59]|nr:MAG: tail-specific protease [Chlamydiae bacterium RIFCSPHIGHO2_01_FULL_44_39]OGN57924.1 MAG: tail-specific protease [Chlamydiae bacterium RIFCSPHIGHO2_02_FULL_45_9]OGN60498.1 MAG: tail-specific protease [Chlamydiae bacterium RIFCSPHIGHO2_12_FULL_44_59]OGN65952.1 MAG: tail-specific protease [Chlamydiae bacterium RIFCSPLOWO2_01_FULL_44_52]OGN68767.1 MAG: tail-specific protease [Chlamydiae bacterium RIFCSPLOWO2_02_FULL_45_22]OGN70408.1 MAG: tail-specific protease [Chlamydiae bacterium RIFCSPLO
MLFRFTFLIFILIFSVSEAKPPRLAPHIVKNKIEEILKAHVSYKRWTAELVDRTLKNFLDELDPTKTYFVEEAITKWLEPTPETLQRALDGFHTGDFSLFYDIHAAFAVAIDRRGEIEDKILSMELPKGVKSAEFKDLSWATNDGELLNRILRIKALQLDATQKLASEHQSRFIQRLQKGRINREQEFIGGTKEEQTRQTLSVVLKAAASALDAHTNYFTPKEANQFMIQVQQRLFGIGAQLRDDLDGLSVVRILENSPASLSNKLKINDKIIAVNQESIIGMEITEAVELIRGEQGSSVLLTILRQSGDGEERKSETLEIALVRNEVILEETRLESVIEPYGDGVIAILKLYSFYQDQNNCSASDIRKAIEEIEKEHALKGVILDLRSNAGGLLAQAVSVTGLFINKGIVVSIKDHLGKIQHLREVEGTPVWQGPLFCLVNRASASAAEIVSQTLQDYGRAIVLGDAHTFGKGSFQTFTLEPHNSPKVNSQGEYKVTRGKYYTVSGKSPQLIGVASEIVIPGILSELDIGEAFAKFPLENDSIPPNFEDDLSDLSPFHKMQLGSMYKYHQQERLTTYEPYIKKLNYNSTMRIERNKNYQGFLKELAQKNFDAESVNLFAQTDLQLIETLNVMKDLILLRELKGDL